MIWQWDDGDCSGFKTTCDQWLMQKHQSEMHISLWRGWSDEESMFVFTFLQCIHRCLNNLLQKGLRQVLHSWLNQTYYIHIDDFSEIPIAPSLLHCYFPRRGLLFKHAVSVLCRCERRWNRHPSVDAQTSLSDMLHNYTTTHRNTHMLTWQPRFLKHQTQQNHNRLSGPSRQERHVILTCPWFQRGLMAFEALCLPVL